MRGSFTIGRIFGIRIRMHWLFLLLIAFLTLPPLLAGAVGNAIGILLAVTLLFVFVLLHELGHSLAARRLGIQVIDITLWPLGGLARLGRIPERPTSELAIAVAGPAVNVVLALLLLYPALKSGADLPREVLAFDPSTYASFCFLANVYMATFNFIPAFPMDGGRVLRALLGYRLGFVRATRVAVRVGRVFALAFVLFGILKGHWMLVLIGFFIFVTGSQEERAMRWRSALESVRGSGLVLDEEGKPIGFDENGPNPDPRV